MMQESFGSFVTNTYGDRYLYEVNRSCFNRLGSHTVFRQQYAAVLKEKNRLTIFVGTDSGLLPAFFAREGVPSGSRLLFIELPEVLSRLRQDPLFEEPQGAIRLVSTENWAAHLAEVNLTAYAYLENIVLNESFGCMEGHLPAYREVQAVVQRELEAQVWSLRASIQTKHFLEAQLLNAADCLVPAQLLRDQFKGKTAIVLGGGPSLDQVLPWIKEHRDELLVIAVSRIARRLLQIGLEPHLVFNVDPNEASYDISKQMFQFSPEVVFVHAYHATPWLVGQWQHRSLYLGERLPWKSKLNCENLSVCGPTVTNVALDCALRMGFSRILLAGFDLCFDRSGKTHAQGSYEADAGPMVSQLLPQLETYAGYQASTTQAYYFAWEHLGTLAEEARKQGCRLINLAAGAARVEGIAHQPVAEIQFDATPETMQDSIMRLVPQPSLEERKKDLDSLCAELRRTEVRMKKISRLAQEGLDCNAGLFGRGKGQADFKYKVRMDRVEATLNREYADLVPLVKSHSLGAFLKTCRPDEESEWTDEEIEAIGQQYYQAYLESSQQLLELLTRARERAEARLEEMRPDADLLALCRRWEEERTYNRVAIRRERFSDPEDQAIHREMERVQSVFLSDQQDLAVYDRRDMFDPAKTFGELKLFFHRQDRTSLEKLAERLQAFEERESELLQLLARGYLTELVGNNDEALDTYRLLVESEMPNLMEEALVRIASLSIRLQDHDNALLALECLAGLAPVHQPHYAEMLVLMGRSGDAAEVLGDYLQRVPEDHTAMLRLAQVYHDMGADEAARLALGYLLEADPKNEAAKALQQAWES